MKKLVMRVEDDMKTIKKNNLLWLV